MTNHSDLLRALLALAHERTEHLAATTSAVELYTDGAQAAVERLPEPWGTAIGAVLAIAAEQRRATGLRGSLGEHRSTLALALLVLDHQPTAPAPPSTPDQNRT